jgi:hypothetical protein
MDMESNPKDKKEPGRTLPPSEDELSESLRTSLLEAYRSQVGASAAVLDRLAEQPVSRRRSEVAASGGASVDILLAAPSQAWADAVVERLPEVLGTDVQLTSLGPTVPRSDLTQALNLRLCATFPWRDSDRARKRIREAFQAMPEVDFDYSEPIDLFVVTARP